MFMRPFFLLFLFCGYLLAEDPYLIAVTENDLSIFVDGVSMITGDFYVSEEDYVVAGAEPISTRRFYLSRGGFSQGMPHLHAVFIMGKSSFRKLQVIEPNGTLVEYSLDPNESGHAYEIGDDFYYKKRSKHFRPYNFLTAAQGVSNTASGNMSAKTQLKNQLVVFDYHNDPKGKSFTLYTADGTIRRYINDMGQTKEGAIVMDKEEGYPQASSKFYDQYTYRLEYEQLPNGHVRHCRWDSKNQFLGIYTSNLKGDKTFANLIFDR